LASLIREAKDFNDTSALKEANGLYSQVEETTDAVLDFNDKYLETDDFTSLPKDLSDIGERLAVRFEAEDRMISVLHDAHRDLVA
jgi:regulator of sigma D